MLTFVFCHQMVLWNMSRGHKIVQKHSRGWWQQYIKRWHVHIVAQQHGTLSSPRASADATARIQSCSHHWVFYNTHTSMHTYTLNTHKDTYTSMRGRNSNHPVPAVCWGFYITHTPVLTHVGIDEEEKNMQENMPPQDKTYICMGLVGFQSLGGTYIYICATLCGCSRCRSRAHLQCW